MNSQATFAAALLDPQAPCPGGLTTWNGSDPAARFAVYRNNVMVSLIDALAQTYPVVQALVGETFFRAMAAVYARAHPPRSPVMAWYGQTFAEFVASFLPASTVPYLSDVARLEWAQVQAYHAADLPPLALDVLQTALQDPQQLAQLGWTLHPSVQVIDSAFAVLSIWLAHQPLAHEASVDNPDLAQSVLVLRDGLNVHALALSPGVGRFIVELQRGQPLLQAAQTASEQHPEFDLPQALSLLLQWQLVTAMNSGEPHRASIP